jgi:Arabinose efflux permease
MTKRRMAIATIALLIANFMGGLDATIVNTALPAITSDLNGIRLIGWISSIFLLGTAVTTVLWGRVGEIIGKKLTFQISLMLFVISSVVGGMSTNMIMLIVARALMGIGAGGMVSIPLLFTQIFIQILHNVQSFRLGNCFIYTFNRSGTTYRWLVSRCTILALGFLY